MSMMISVFPATVISALVMVIRKLEAVIKTLKTVIRFLVTMIAATMMAAAVVVATIGMMVVACKAMAACSGQHSGCRQDAVRNFSLKYYKSHGFFVSCQFIGYLCTEI